MAITGIQGQLLEINIIGCRHLRDKEWLTKQDPYVVLDYANNRFRTKTDTDGGKNPSFNEKYTLPLIEGLREINVQVWNSNTLTFDDLIGTGRIQLEKTLSTGYDDSSWHLTSKSGKNAGEVRIIMHYSNGKNHQAHTSARQEHSAVPPSHIPYAGYHPPPQYAPSSYRTYPSEYPQGHTPAGYPPAYGPAGYPPAHAPSGYPPHTASSAYSRYPPPEAPHGYSTPYPPSVYPSPIHGYGPPPGAHPPYSGGHPGYPYY